MKHHLQGRTFKIAIFVFLVCLAPSACSSGTPDDTPEASDEATSQPKLKASPCIKLDVATLKGLEDGLKVGRTTFIKGAAVKLPAEQTGLNIRYVAAVRAKDPSTTETLIFGIGAPEEGGGPIIAADNFAKLYTNWGEAMTMGSPMDRQRGIVYPSRSAQSAADCVR